MHKMILVIVAGCILGNIPANAQMLGGFFNQKGTQRKYMLQQIALYKVYLGYLKKGYSITRDGLQTIGDIRKGELSVHSDYYNGLKAVNPSVRKIPQVDAALDNSRRILDILNGSIEYAVSSSLCSPSEIGYLQHTKQMMEGQVHTTLNALETAITAGTQMTDDERMQRILAAYEQSASQYGFARQLSEDLLRLISQRRQLGLEVRKSIELQTILK